MKPSKPFVMPPVRIIPPTLEGQSESSKSLEEWLNTEETVRDLHFGKRTEEHMEYSYKASPTVLSVISNSSPAN